MRFLPSSYYRAAVVSAVLFCWVLSGKGQPITPPSPYSAAPANYVKTWQALGPGLDSNTILTQPVTASQQATQYFDGLGRVVQTVAKQASPLQKDMVTAVFYDQYGRQQWQYLPFTSVVAQGGDVTNDGNFKLDAFQQSVSFNQGQFPGENYYYSQTQYEASPLNRLTAALPAGNNWVGSNRGVG